VLAPDGNSYERAAIEEWILLKNDTSPQTRETMNVDDLVPNHALREIIEDQLNERLGRPSRYMCSFDAIASGCFHGYYSEQLYRGWSDDGTWISGVLGRKLVVPVVAFILLTLPITV